KSDDEREDGAAPQGGALVQVSSLPKPRSSTAESDARVLVDAAVANLEVQVRPRRPPGRALECDGRATRHHLSAGKARCVPRQMSVVGRVTVAVDDHEQVAVPDAARVQVGDSSVGCDYLGPIGSRDV